MRDVGHNFPIKLHSLLDTEDPDVVTWTQNGDGFRINDMERFRDEVLPKYWRHTKMTSFQRQMNLYGFKKINYGDDIGAYYHPLFERGRRDMLEDVRRSAVKSSAVKKEKTTISKAIDKVQLSSASILYPESVMERIEDSCKRTASSQMEHFRNPQFSPDFLQIPVAWRQVVGPQSSPDSSYAEDGKSAFGDVSNKRQRADSEVLDENFFDFRFFFERLKYLPGPQPNAPYAYSEPSDGVFFEGTMLEDIISDEEYSLLMAWA